MIQCPTVADPNPKPGKPRFGCSFSTIGSSDVENVSIHYLEKDKSGVEASPEVVQVTQGLGKLFRDGA